MIEEKIELLMLAIDRNTAALKDLLDQRAATPAPKAKAEPKVEPPKPAAPKYTLQQVSDATRELCTVGDIGTASDILAKHSAKSAKALNPSQYIDYMEDITAAIAAAKGL